MSLFDALSGNPEIEIITYPNRKAWVKDSKRFLGASEVACLYGDGYQTLLRLWAEKRGELDRQPDDEAENEEDLWYGLAMEPVTAARYEKVTGRKVEKVPAYTRIVPKDAPFMAATLDYLQDAGGELGVMDCKNLKRYSAGQYRVGKASPGHMIQIQAQARCSYLNMGTLAATIDGSRLVHVDFHANPDFIKRMVEAAHDFMEAVKTGREPRATGLKMDTETLKELHPKDDGRTVTLPATFTTLDRRRERYKNIAKKAEVKVDEIGNQIRQAIGDATYGVVPESGASYSWKAQESAGYITVLESELDKLKEAKIEHKVTKGKTKRVLLRHEPKGIE